jgi:hypothetical protein
MAEIADFVGEIIDEVKAEVARIGMFFEEVEELEAYGNLYSAVAFRCASVNLENPEMQRLLSEVSPSWSRIFRALALERLIADNPVRLQDYVEVEEVHWSTRSSVRLCICACIDELLGEYKLGEADPREMEEALEGILDYEARCILRRLNKALAEEYASREVKR